MMEVGVSRRSRVLIADDHPAIVTAVSRLLSLDHDVVGSVADGSRLLDAVHRLQPDVIVLDVNLPKVDGLDACRQLTQANPAVKIIVFTAVVDPTTQEKALAAGAAAFLSKLGSADDLLSTVERLSKAPA